MPVCAAPRGVPPGWLSPVSEARARWGPGGMAAPMAAEGLVKVCLLRPSDAKQNLVKPSQMTKVEMAAGCSNVWAEGECLGRDCPPTRLSKPEIVQYCPQIASFCIGWWT